MVHILDGVRYQRRWGVLMSGVLALQQGNMAPKLPVFRFSGVSPLVNANTYTWSGVNIGPAAADRKILLFLSIQTTGTAQYATDMSLTVNGVAATFSFGTQGLIARHVAMFVFELAAGTTANIQASSLQVINYGALTVFSSTIGVVPRLTNVINYNGTTSFTLTKLNTRIVPLPAVGIFFIGGISGVTATSGTLENYTAGAGVSVAAMTVTADVFQSAIMAGTLPSSVFVVGLLAGFGY